MHLLFHATILIKLVMIRGALWTTWELHSLCCHTTNQAWNRIAEGVLLLTTQRLLVWFPLNFLHRDILYDVSISRRRNCCTALRLVCTYLVYVTNVAKMSFELSTHCGLATQYGDIDLVSNGLLPDGTKPWFEAILTFHWYDFHTSTWEQF